MSSVPSRNIAKLFPAEVDSGVELVNLKRRKRLQAVVDELAEIIEEEQTAFDNTPESIQDSDIGGDRQEVIDDMEEAKDTLTRILEK